MNSIFIDTNIFAYFLTHDNPAQQAEVIRLFTHIESGIIKPYTSDVVILELIYLLHKHYKQPRKTISRQLSGLLTLRNLTLIDKANTVRALELFSETRIKSGDCFIATQIPERATMITYDTEFAKFPFLKVQTPAQYLEAL